MATITKELFEILEREKVVSNQISEFIQHISVHLLEDDNPELKVAFENAIKLVRERASLLVDKEIEDYESYFTTNEINELIQFYRSQLGKKILKFNEVIGPKQKEFSQRWITEIFESTLKEAFDKL